MSAAAKNQFKAKEWPDHPATVVPVLEMDRQSYLKWRDTKLESYKTAAKHCLVEVSNPHDLSDPERIKISQIIASNNFVIYQYRNDRPDYIDGYQSICRQLGLLNSIANPGADHNNITIIEDSAGGHPDDHPKNRYVPYTRQKLNWHTDGYYNEGESVVRSFVLHCQQPAMAGGKSWLLDPEIAYILLRDQNPDMAQALCHPACLTIPANIEHGKIVRRAFTGAVFSTDPLTGHLYTRYTQRKHNVHWRVGEDTFDAISSIKSLLESDNPWLLNINLQPGQGMICNNILHSRGKFIDDSEPDTKRRLFRIRFNDRINSTSAVRIITGHTKAGRSNSTRPVPGHTE